MNGCMGEGHLQKWINSSKVQYQEEFRSYMPQGMVQKNKIEEERRQQGRGWWESIQTKSKGILDDCLNTCEGLSYRWKQSQFASDVTWSGSIEAKNRNEEKVTCGSWLHGS